MSDLDIKLTFAFVQMEIQEFKDFLQRVRNLLPDKDKDLDTRWGIYLQIQPFLKTDGMYHHFDTLGEVSWYDDFYLERAETLQLDDDFIKRAIEVFKLSAEQQDALKEEVLEYAAEQSYGSFENDW